MRNKIKSLKAREILDSRGNPTLEVELQTGRGVFLSSVPSGASKGSLEASELRDKGKRYQGKGVLKAVGNVNRLIAPKLRGKEASDQRKIDRILIKLDGTKNKSRLGANALVGVSMACCRAGAGSLSLYRHISGLYQGSARMSLPLPSFNVINGGQHAGNNLDIQEIMIIPGKKSFSLNLQTASEVYHLLKKEITEKYSSLGANVGDEGGFAPPLKSAEEALELIMKASKGRPLKIALDCAASHFYRKGKYFLGKKAFSREKLLEYYKALAGKFPLASIEDPFQEKDWQGFSEITSKLGKKLKIVGDDLLVSNPAMIEKAGRLKACNALLLKVNQIGTVSEALESARLAESLGWSVMVSHRSGETCDDFIADLAVGIGARFIKSGAPCRGERVCKYNRLLKIEKEIKS